MPYDKNEPVSHRSYHLRDPERTGRSLDGWWYYEERGGLRIYRESGGTAWLPLVQLRRYLDRLEKKFPSD